VPVAGDQSMFQRIVEGARAARAEPGCRSAIMAIAVVALLASPFIALVPAMAHVVRPHGWSLALTTAVLITAQGVGAVAGALALPGLAVRFGRVAMLRVALIAVPILLCAYGLAPDLAVAVPVFVAVGAAYISVLSGLNTVVQLRAPVAARGRILSIYMMALGLVYPVGAVIQGRLANTHGIRAVTATAAVLLLVVVALTALFRPVVFSDLADPTPDPVADGASPGPGVAPADEHATPGPSPTVGTL